MQKNMVMNITQMIMNETQRQAAELQQQRDSGQITSQEFTDRYHELYD